jgi:outer membrane lipoprotein-sorting protein
MKLFNLLKVYGLIVPILLSALPGLALAQTNMSPESILQKMDKIYSEITTYQDSGIIENVIDSSGGSKITRKNNFKIWFKRPKLLRVGWTSSMFGRIEDNNVLWSDGENTYIFWNHQDQLEKEKSLKNGIIKTTGVSGGVTNTVPSRLLGNSHGAKYLGAKIVKEEGFEGIQCYVISCKKEEGYDCAFWISKNDFLLRKFEYTVKSLKKLVNNIQDKQNKIKAKISVPDLTNMPNYSIVHREIHRNITVDKQIEYSIFKFGKRPVNPVGCQN